MDLAGDGGDSSAVQDQLKNVQHIQASALAFAAILDNGSVVTWGDAGYGGDSGAVQDQLKKVQRILAASSLGRAFAAILDDGSVVTWGDAEYGGDSGAVQVQLKNVPHIQASPRAFAAILDDAECLISDPRKRLGLKTILKDSDIEAPMLDSNKDAKFPE